MIPSSIQNSLNEAMQLIEDKENYLVFLKNQLDMAKPEIIPKIKRKYQEEVRVIKTIQGMIDAILLTGKIFEERLVSASQNLKSTPMYQPPQNELLDRRKINPEALREYMIAKAREDFPDLFTPSKDHTRC